MDKEIKEEIAKALSEQKEEFQKILNSGRKMYELGKKDERERIIKEYGNFNDGCGCCSEESLKKALLQ